MPRGGWKFWTLNSWDVDHVVREKPLWIYWFIWFYGLWIIMAYGFKERFHLTIWDGEQTGDRWHVTRVQCYVRKFGPRGIMGNYGKEAGVDATCLSIWCSDGRWGWGQKVVPPKDIQVDQGIKDFIPKSSHWSNFHHDMESFGHHASSSHLRPLATICLIHVHWPNSFRDEAGYPPDPTRMTMASRLLKAETQPVETATQTDALVPLAIVLPRGSLMIKRKIRIPMRKR